MLSQATPIATDSGQFVPMFEQYEKLYGSIGNETPLDADYGYWGEETLKNMTGMLIYQIN